MNISKEQMATLLAKSIDEMIDRGFAKNKSEIARHFDMKPSSLYGWTDNGRIARYKLPHIIGYFKPVTRPSDWGFETWPDWILCPTDQPQIEEKTAENNTTRSDLALLIEAYTTASPAGKNALVSVARALIN